VRVPFLWYSLQIHIPEQNVQYPHLQGSIDHRVRLFKDPSNLESLKRSLTPAVARKFLLVRSTQIAMDKSNLLSIYTGVSPRSKVAGAQT
jgi:hypothetical protein